MIAFATAGLQNPINIANFLYLKLALFTLAYNFNNRPMSTNVLNYIENSNETFILITGYFIFFFSEWIYDPIFLDS